MAKARGEAGGSSDKASNRAMELALASAGIVNKDEKGASSPSAENKRIAHKAKHAPPQKKAPQSALSKPKKSPPDPEQVREIERKAQQKRQRRKAREAAQRAAVERRLAEAAQREIQEQERREAERAQRVITFIKEIERASYTELIGAWRKHLDYIRYNQLVSRHAARTALYEKLIAAIEKEWFRRSRLSASDAGYFPWPTTKASRGKGGIGTDDWAPQGMLSYLGYHVGNASNLLREQRHAILRRAFSMHLPPVDSPAYMSEWGEPATASRLRKMAYSLASFAKQAKLQTQYDKSQAVEDWESDLQMLHDEYYVGKFGFGRIGFDWPRI